MANITGIRGDEHATERTTARRGKRGCFRPGGLDRQTVRSGCLNENVEDSPCSTRFLRSFCNTTFRGALPLWKNWSKRCKPGKNSAILLPPRSIGVLPPLMCASSSSDSILLCTHKPLLHHKLLLQMLCDRLLLLCHSFLFATQPSGEPYKASRR